MPPSPSASREREYLRVVTRDPGFLVQARGHRLLTEVARQAQVSVGLLSELETGRRRGVSPRLAARIELALRVQVGSLFVLESEVRAQLEPYSRAVEPTAAVAS